MVLKELVMHLVVGVCEWCMISARRWIVPATSDEILESSLVLKGLAD